LTKIGLFSSMLKRFLEDKKDNFGRKNQSQ